MAGARTRVAGAAQLPPAPPTLAAFRAQASLPAAMAGETSSPTRPAWQGGGGQPERDGAKVASRSATGRRCPAGERRGGGDRLARGGKPSGTRRSNGEVGQHVIAEALYPSGNGVNGRLLNFYRAFFRSRCSTIFDIRVLKERIAAPGAGSLNLVLLALYPVCDAVQRVQRKMEWLLHGGT